MQPAFRIERDIPIPASQRGKGGAPSRPKTALRAGLEELQVGESFLVHMNGRKNPQAYVAGLAGVVRKNTGKAFVTRKVEGGIRVWRTL